MLNNVYLPIEGGVGTGDPMQRHVDDDTGRGKGEGTPVV